MDSKTAVNTLLAVDPGFTELCKSLFGDAVDPQDAWDFLYSTDRPVVVGKGMPDMSAVNVKRGIGAAKGVLKRKKVRATAAMGATAGAGAIFGNAAGRGKSQGGESSDEWGYSITRDRNNFGKADDDIDTDEAFGVTWAGEFSKVDTDKREVFGWASVVEIDGKPVVDRQGDLITPDEIERAAYQYVVKSRKGGHQHKRNDDGEAFHASDMIESVVFTPEKIAKMGLPDDFPVGWWVGYKVHDDNTWNLVKNDGITGFSIHGKGKRQPIAEVEA